jgi:hypothetical protein
MRGRDVCSAHAGRTGAPRGNRNRETHGLYARPARPLASIDDVLDDAMQKHTQLSAYIEQHTGDLPIVELVKLFALHGQNASRLGRLLRDKRALSGQSADGLLDAIGKALDEISTELGVKL